MRLRALATACLLTLAGLAAPVAASAAPTSSSPDAGGLYRPVTTTRVLDTRASHALAAGTVLTFPVAGRGAIATGAGAVSANVTVLTPSRAGSVSVFAGGTAWNGSASISFPAGASAQNMLTTQLGATGSLSVRNNLAVPVQLIVDVTGYYTGGTVGAAGAYQPVVPQRPYDARRTPTHLLTAAHTATFAVGGTGAVPADASAVELNLTVLTPARAGSVSVFTDAWNGSATASFSAGINVQHMLTESLDFYGQLSVRNNTAAGLAIIVDVVGYYRAGPAVLPGAFTPVSPTRVLDSRLGTPGQYPIGSNGTETFPTLHVTAAGGTSTVPVSGVSAVAVNVTVIAPSLTSSVAVYPGDTGWNGSATMSFTAGQSQQSMLTTRVGIDGSLTVHNNAPGNPSTAVLVVADVYGYFLGEANPYAPATAQQVDPAHGVAATVSCPSASFCVAVEANGYLLTYDGSSWSAAARPAGFTGSLHGVSCSSTTFCLAAGSASLVWDGTSWSPHPVPNPADEIDVVSCVSPTFCMASTVSGYYTRYDGTSWQPEKSIQVPYTLRHLSCASPEFCLGTNSNGQLSRWDGSAWSIPAQQPGLAAAATQVSCPTTTFCAAENSPPRTGTDAHSQLSTFDGSTWSAPVTMPGEPAMALTCPAAASCLGVDLTGRATWFDGSSWAPLSADPVTAPDSLTAACASTDQCVTIGRTELDPTSTYHAGTWSPIANLDVQHGGVDHVSCPAATFCLASNDVGALSSYDGTRWSAAGILPAIGTVSDLTCTTAQFCVAVGSSDKIAMYDGTGWRIGGIDPNWNLTAVSCPSTTFCVAVDSTGHAQTFDGVRWSTPLGINSQFDDISCPVARYCVAVSRSGYPVDVLAAGGWSPQSVLAGSPHRVSCASTSYCLISAYTAGSNDYRAMVWNGAALVPVPATSFQLPVALACPAAGSCLGLSPAATVGWDGAGWTVPLPALAAAPGLSDLSCPTSSFCMAVIDDRATPLTAD
ncbi:MAG TPA: hypothetical protein VMB79_11485 [Jatrophihabitans sp.]|nr:hypothetical protein [Jatrophihabitans sp.]